MSQDFDPLQKEIQQVHVSIEQAKEIVKLGEEAIALAENPLFEKLVLKGYFIDEAARLVHLYGDPNISADIKAKIQSDLAGPAHFKRYMQTFIARGRAAHNEIAAHQQSLEELHQMEQEDMEASE